MDRRIVSMKWAFFATTDDTDFPTDVTNITDNLGQLIR
jgi:hypothetical protein